MFKKVYLEITNVCNLKCSFCIGNKRENQFLTEEEFKIILERLKPYTKYLYFHILGEPLLHPQINQFIDIGSKDYYINITSNGYLIKRIKDNKNIRQINISLHSFDEIYDKSLEDYLEDIFGSVDNLIDNHTIVTYRMWVGSPYKNLIIKRLEEKYATLIGDRIKVKLGDTIYYEVEKEFIWPSYANSYTNCNGSCRGTRDFIGILVNGDVVPCCLDSEGIIKLGNIYKDNIRDIIKNNLFKEMKKGFMNNHKYHDLCKKCNFYDLRRE